MADILSKDQRHKCMSHIKGKNTKPEILVRRFLFAKGFRYRLHCKDLPGKPDVVLPKYKTVIFINGCFWHGHQNCKYASIPETNSEFWQAKILGNIERDKANYSQLQKQGWRIIEIWQCQLKPGKIEQTLQNIIIELKNEQK